MVSVVIVGAGIIGITTAICLLKQGGFNVTVLTKDDPLKTNSDAAVAFFYVPESDKPLLQRLSLESLSTWLELSTTKPASETGVQITPMVYYFNNEKEFKESIWSSNILREQLHITESIPEGYLKSINFPIRLLVHLPIIDPSIYRPYLFKQFQFLKGKLKREKIKSLAALADHYDIVLNCAGWEAKYLTQDEGIYPVRGQVEILKIKETEKERIQRFSGSLYVRDKDSYIIYRPQSLSYAIGTTYQINDTSLIPRQADKEDIFDRIGMFISKEEVIRESTVTQVGIRCGRSDVRLEEEIIESADLGKKALLIHCYGHSGCGWSASWGSAAAVLRYCLDYCDGKKKISPPIQPAQGIVAFSYRALYPL